MNISVSLYGHQEFKPTAQPPRVPDTDSEGHILPQCLQALCLLAIGVLPSFVPAAKLKG